MDANDWIVLSTIALLAGAGYLVIVGEWILAVSAVLAAFIVFSSPM